MGDKTGIAWTDATWNPIRGCSRVSEGCRNCYAERMAVRSAASAYAGLIKGTPLGPRWTGKVAFVESMLDQPLRWKAPRRIFVNSMSDLFHEAVPDEWIDRIFAVMALAPRHTFQVLTKRPARMLRYFEDPGFFSMNIEIAVEAALGGTTPWHWPGPLPNVHLGVSVEDQATTDERVPLLLETPAAVRWVSYEPALGPVDFRPRPKSDLCLHCGEGPGIHVGHPYRTRGLDWVVVGGESGPGARPFDLAWARQTIAQGKAASVPVFCKQLGAVVAGTWGDDATQPHSLATTGTVLTSERIQTVRWFLKDRKGADPAEWPEDLRVQEFPR